MSANKLIAAIDMGTNTFHMLIAYVEDRKLHEVFRLRKWVNLAESGLNRIGEASIQRAWEALSEFKIQIEKYQVESVNAVATEAFRSSENGMHFLKKVEEDLNIKATIISGSKEAELIYKGISILRPGQEDGASLIMDIGGGSTEFILYNESGIVWSKSYIAGVTYLFNEHVETDPLIGEEEQQLIYYFNDQFADLLAICMDYKINDLIGASGSFEVVEMMMGMHPSRTEVTCVGIDHFMEQYDYLRNSTLIERIEDPRIPDNRAKLIVVAYVLMKYIIDHVKPLQLCVSPYAMKEGIIRENV